eukprot:TRINITY_DN16831_c0_g1_i2.p1 TRINITY_DN16831_c0_g1~~TRINITY_DN16831_c0_g1_i2.p1  ORF type:complete len:318 (+),score=89.82 TRINITY_DN16831_c0_g1_i2:17-970(+)
MCISLMSYYVVYFFFLMIRRPPRSTLSSSSAASDVYKRQAVDVTKLGKWAVVTGASEGIGAAYCQVFAQKKLNVLLISRSADKLAKTESELKEKYGVETKVFAADLGTLSSDPVAKAALEKEINGLDIAVLVNNVGISYEFPAILTDLEDKRVDQMIDLNVVATTYMTKMVLPGMVDRKRGAIISVSSAAGVMSAGSPMLAMYAGTKAFVERFMRSLSFEYASSNIVLQTHTPYFVKTAMSKMRASLMCPMPIAYARASVAKIGVGGPAIVPYWSHALQHLVVESLPTGLAATQVLGMHKGIRKKALAKQAREAKKE